MRGARYVVGWMVVGSWLGFSALAGRAEAFIVINEVLADPAAGLNGDANADGVRSSTQDEFVEFLNNGAGAVDLSGWSLADAASTRHIFPSGTFLLPFEFLVVFGGGDPSLPGIHWQKASGGTLSLNNSSEILTLMDAGAGIVDQVAYDDLANQDQSLVRFPEGTGKDLVLHAGLPQAHGALFSPGTSVDGGPLDRTTVPEPLTICCFAAGCLMMARRKIAQNT